MAETIGALLCRAGSLLRAAGIEEPRREARLLLGHALGLDPAQLVARAQDAVQPRGFEALLALRAARVPAAHILGRREFWGLCFAVSADVLVPRPETETLIEAALDARPDRAGVRDVLDLGTGSGCLLCAALAEFPAAHGIGLDRSAAALAVARANAARLGLGDRAGFVAGDWLAPLAARFDLVLANPPYVAEAEMAGLAPELAHEPRQALVAGADGLDAYRALLPGLAGALAPGGIAVLELGAGQAGTVAALAPAAGLAVRAIRHDLATIPRALVLARG